MDTETTNLVDGGDTSVEDTAAVGTEVETEGLTTEQFDENGDPIATETVEEDTEEVDYEGQKYKVPKALKDALLRQADYTRKTQEVAELRKAAEAERARFHQASEDEVKAHAKVVALDEQIAEFNKVDWQAWHAQDPFEAQAAFMRFQQAQNIRAQTAGQLTQLQQQRALAAQQETARRIEEGRAVLSREIPGWDAKKAAEVLDGGVREYRFEKSEIEDFEDPRMVIVLNDALQWRAHQKTQAKVQNHVKAQQAQPAATVKAKSAPPTGLDDRLSPDEWVRRRNEQLRKRS